MKKVAFDWTDPLLLEASLREDERLVRDSARGFAQTRLMPLVRDMHRQEGFDPALLREMGALGLLGSTLEEFGGVSPVAYGDREVEKVDSAFGSPPVHRLGISHPCLRQRGRGKISPQTGARRWFGASADEAAQAPDPGLQARPQARRVCAVAPDLDHPCARRRCAGMGEAGCWMGFILEQGDTGLTTPKIEGKFSRAR